MCVCIAFKMLCTYLCLNLVGQMMETLTYVTVKGHWPCKYLIICNYVCMLSLYLQKNKERSKEYFV